MKDYAQMTDFELNLMLAKKMLDWDDIELKPRKEGQTAVAWGDGYNWYDFDACHDWSVVGPLMVEYKINLTVKNRYSSNLSWDATEVTSDMDPKTANHTNPRRAVIIVFLMMEEANETN